VLDDIAFLGFTFRTRSARGKSGALFASFQPAISNDAHKKISEQIRRWRLHRRIGLSLADLARWINPVVRGWMQYYGAFYRSALVSAPIPHQRLPDAVDPQEIQTVARADLLSGLIGLIPMLDIGDVSSGQEAFRTGFRTFLIQ
jgi:hypothetical protein